jgi:predicted AAA+ superfamily ATPase
MTEKSFVRHLAQILAKNQILILSGPRMVGKRLYAEQISKQLKRKILLLDLSKSVIRRKLVHPEFLFTSHFRELIILESIEYLPSIIQDIQFLISKSKKHPKFILTVDFKFESVNHFFRNSKKSVVREIFPASLNFATRIKSVSMWQHWLKGGFPGFLTAPSHRVLGNRADRLIQEISNFDTSLIFDHQLKPEKIERCLELMAELNGTVLNSQLIARAMGVTGPTALRYVQYLEASMAIRLLPSFEPGAGKRLIRSPKIYFRDTGLLHYLRGIQTLKVLSNSARQPDSWEAYVTEEVAKVLPARYKLHYYRTQHAAEAQLVISKPGKFSNANRIAVVAIFIPVEPFTHLPRGLRNSLSDLSTRKNFILLGNNPGFPNPVLPETISELKAINCIPIQLPDLLQRVSLLRL